MMIARTVLLPAPAVMEPAAVLYRLAQHVELVILLRKVVKMMLCVMVPPLNAPPPRPARMVPAVTMERMCVRMDLVLVSKTLSIHV